MTSATTSTSTAAGSTPRKAAGAAAHPNPDHTGDGQGIRKRPQDRRRPAAGDPTRRAARAAVESTGRPRRWPVPGAARLAAAGRGAAGRRHITAVAGASGSQGGAIATAGIMPQTGVFSTRCSTPPPTADDRPGQSAPFSGRPMNWGWGGSSGGSRFAASTAAAPPSTSEVAAAW